MHILSTGSQQSHISERHKKNANRNEDIKGCGIKNMTRTPIGIQIMDAKTPIFKRRTTPFLVNNTYCTNLCSDGIMGLMDDSINVTGARIGANTAHKIGEDSSTLNECGPLISTDG